jgi:hypothetical protein
MSTQITITAVDAEAAELDATRAVYDMLKPLGCEAQTRVLDHVYYLLRRPRQKHAVRFIIRRILLGTAPTIAGRPG